MQYNVDATYILKTTILYYPGVASLVVQHELGTC